MLDNRSGQGHAHSNTWLNLIITVSVYSYSLGTGAAVAGRGIHSIPVAGRGIHSIPVAGRGIHSIPVAGRGKGGERAVEVEREQVNEVGDQEKEMLGGRLWKWSPERVNAQRYEQQCLQTRQVPEL